MISIKKTETSILVTSPYSASFVDRARQLGGKWEGSVWAFQAGLEQEVRDALIQIYGTDDFASDEKVTVLIETLDDWYQGKGALMFAGKTIARAFGRDSGAKVGDDVAIIEGRAYSCGSVKNWASEVGEGSKIKVFNVSRPMLEKELEKGNSKIKVTVL